MRALTLATFLTILIPFGAAWAHEETFAYDEAAPAAGFWTGRFSEGEGGDGDSAAASMFVEVGEDGTWTVAITCLDVGLMNTAGTEVEADASTIAFTVPVMGDQKRLSGEVSDDGQHFTGTIPVGDDDEIVQIAFTRSARPVDLPSPMAFNGELPTPQMALDITVVVAETPAGGWVGHIDIPAQGLHGFPLVDVGREGDTFTATVPVRVPATITADLSDDGQTLSGQFQQSVFNLPVELARLDSYSDSKLKRPQHPSPPYPYTVREVTVEHPDGHTLAGTLTLPEGEGPFVAAVMATGSGPQDRDEMIFEHRPFLVIADHLTRHGIAVLRCDDRGFGESTGDFGEATSEDFASDALAQVRYLTTLPEIDPDRIGIIGHSEGGLVAPLAAVESDDVAFAVLLAGPGVTGKEILELQSRLIQEANGVDPLTIAQQAAVQRTFLTYIAEGKSEDELRAALDPVVRAQLAAQNLSEDEAADAIDQEMKRLASPWMRYFVVYDPRPVLAQLEIPVLACNGTLDLQVWHEQNLDEIERVMTEAGGDITIKRYEGLNHLFQPAKTGTLTEYAMIETTFDEQVLEDMTEWIVEKMGVGEDNG